MQARLTGVCAINPARHAFGDASHAKDLDVERASTRLSKWHPATHPVICDTACKMQTSWQDTRSGG